MNAAGYIIPQIAGVTLKGADGQNYIVKASFLYDYLRKHYGGAMQTYLRHKDIPSGIPFIDAKGIWLRASGHVDVVNNFNWGSCGKHGGYYKINNARDVEIFPQAIVFR